MRIFKSVLFAVLGLATFASCSSDDDENVTAPENESAVQVVLRSSMSDKVATFETTDEVNPLDLHEMFINIAEIEFDISDEMEDELEGDKVYSDVELKGPFPIDLLSEKALNGWTLSTTTVPNGTYEEIEFEFDVYEGNDEELENLKGNTIYASGEFTIGDEVVPFVIKSNEELEVELEYENEPLVLDGDRSKVFIDLDLNEVLTRMISTAGVDFVNATREEDGSILIDKETNEEILDKFEEILEDTFEAIEDAHEDDN